MLFYIPRPNVGHGINLIIFEGAPKSKYVIDHPAAAIQADFDIFRFQYGSKTIIGELRTLFCVEVFRATLFQGFV